MLGQTKENIQAIVNKLTVYDFLLQTLGSCGKDNEAKSLEMAKAICDKKTVLVEEVLKLI